MTIPEGAAVGSLVVGEPLASGDHGDVYAGHQPGVGRRVAIRVVRRSRLHEPGLVERLRREAQLAGRVAHPNLVQVIDYFAFRDDHYLVTEFVEGTDLAALLERPTRLPRDLGAHVLLEAARGLEELHTRGIVHGGLRPDHILLSRWGEVKLKGFAQARELSEAAPDLPPRPDAYASPEVVRGRRVGPKSDVYSLGAILHEILTGAPGRAPVTRRSLVPESRLLRLARRCLAANPGDRPDLGELGRQLARAAGDPAPQTCRLEIAAWLWKERALERRADLVEPAAGSGQDHWASARVEGAAVEVGVPDATAGIPFEEAGSALDTAAAASRDGPPQDAWSGEPVPKRPGVLVRLRTLLTPGVLVRLRTLLTRRNRRLLQVGPRLGGAVARSVRAARLRLGLHRLRRGVAESLRGLRDPLLGAVRTVRRALGERLRLPGASTLRATAVASGALAMAVVGWATLRDEVRALDGPAPVGSAPRASVTFAVEPWASVEIENGPSFLTPRAEPVELGAGEHVVVLRHPTLGEERRELTLEAGEHRIVEHRFEVPEP